MVGITLSAEQVKSAPPEVRRWIEAQLRASLALGEPPTAPGPRDEIERLAALSLEEAAGILQSVTDDQLCSRVFFELGRDAGHPVPAHPELYAIALDDIVRHAQIADGRRLAACFTRIEQAYRSVSGRTDARVIAFDAAGNCYVRDLTHAHIRDLWRAITGAAEAEPPARPSVAPPYHSA